MCNYVSVHYLLLLVCRVTTSDNIVTKSMALPICTPAQKALFADKTFEIRLETYFNKIYDIKVNIESTVANNNTRPSIKMVGQEKSVDDALEELLIIISLFCTKIFDETTGQRFFALFCLIILYI